MSLNVRRGGRLHVIDRNIHELLNEDHDHVMTLPYEKVRSRDNFISLLQSLVSPSSRIKVRPSPSVVVSTGKVGLSSSWWLRGKRYIFFAPE